MHASAFKTRYLPALMLALIVQGCGGGDSSTGVQAEQSDPAASANTLSDADIEGYLKIKRLERADDQTRAAAIATLRERDRMMRAIKAEKRLDAAPLHAEIAELERQIWISNHFERVLSEGIDEELVRAYYREHAASFERTRARLAHVFVRAPRDLDPSERQARKTRAHEALSLARAGTGFEELAREFSDDAATADGGGVLGWVEKGRMEADLDRAIFTPEAKAGLIPELVDTPFGFHVVRIIEGPISGAIPLEEVRADIRYRLRMRLKARETARLLGEEDQS